MGFNTSAEYIRCVFNKVPCQERTGNRTDIGGEESVSPPSNRTPVGTSWRLFAMIENIRVRVGAKPLSRKPFAVVTME